MKKKKIIGFVICFLLLMSVIACSEKEVSQDTAKEQEESEQSEEIKYREGAKVYRVLSEQEITDEEMELLIYKIQKRLEDHSTKAEVLEHTQAESGERLIEIYIPEVIMSDEDYQEILSDSTLEFISGYGTESEKVWLTDEYIKDAHAEEVENNVTGRKEYAVKLTFAEEGTKLLTQATSELLGQQLTIVYDGSAISSPVIQTVITDGNAQIAGIDSQEESENMALLLQMGKLKIELEEIENPNGQ